MIDLFAELREKLAAADDAQEATVNHRATDDATALYNEILARPDGGWTAFIPYLEDAQPSMRFQAAMAVKPHALARIVPILKDLNENARGLAASQAYMELFALRPDGKL